jgi:hypothetical protein
MTPANREESLNLNPATENTEPVVRDGTTPDSLSPRPSARGNTRSASRSAEATLAEEMTIEEARETLCKAGYLPAGTPTSATTLALIIKQFVACAPKIPKALADGLRATAVLIENLQEDRIANGVATQILAAIATPLERLSNSVHRLESITPEGEQTAERQATERPGGAPQLASATAQIAIRPTYAAVTQVQVPPRHAEVMARSQGRDKQVLIEGVEGTNNEDLQRLTERELVDKAETTLELMGLMAADKPEEGRMFVGAQKLQRGGILYLMKTTAAADWLKKPDVRHRFLELYGGGGYLRDRGYAIILQYVPVSFEPGSITARRRVENENELEHEEIIEAKWLKELDKRTPGQRTAFVLANLKTAQAANKILRGGIIVEGKRVFAHKNVPEAKRCMKCQGYRASHKAANCKQIHDTCAKCGQLHRTSECTATPGTQFCCNCRNGGHTASDRNCPVFKEECRRIAKRNPENKYRYFPVMEDPSTWELKEGEQIDRNDRSSSDANEEMGHMAQGSGTGRGTWMGGSRGTGHRGGATTAGRGRGAGFTPPPPDRGWIGREFTSARRVWNRERQEENTAEQTRNASQPPRSQEPSQPRRTRPTGGAAIPSTQSTQTTLNDFFNGADATNRQQENHNIPHA